ncbi:PDZ domain-containing protein [Nonomuraea glycinis]|uniref:Tricorn protease homolog n=1 Tax=Nonomuraea glycinis TaxID=2047744 RepID=A0A918E6E7_9ACTN|nr:S41 family peptidase [Nonomuraea glycinis]MCA2179219.1 PDZ domain-containing protein [Nonomuraea glycinis]GGP10138.1 tricorn protease [Nonomuraea glycinis]
MTTGAYLRYPHLYGDLVAFVADDDVWLAPVTGGRAWRFTADRTPVSNPRFSPDGSHLAWTSSREGASEVFAAELDGSQGERLTYWGTQTTQVRGWSADGRVRAVSATGQSSRIRTWAHEIPLDGGPATRLPYGWVSDLSTSGDRVVTVSPMFREPSSWKRYRGGTAGKIWVDADGSGEFTRLFADNAAQHWAAMWVGDRIAFLADTDGTGNLYSCLPDGSDLRRHSTHDEFYARHASTDGERVIYGHAGDLWLLESLDAEPYPLDVKLSGPRPARARKPAPARVGSFSPDATGRASAVEIRGTAHWLTHRDGPAGALRVQPGVRVRLPRALDADGRALWVSDASGEDGLEIGTPGGEIRTLAAGELGRVLDLAASPDGKHAAVATHDGRLLAVDLESGQLRQLDRTAHGDISGLTFSPDSAWLAWVHPHQEPLSQIKIGRVDGTSSIEVTPLRFSDYGPVFTKDGKHLAFLSVRTFDPVYDAHVFDLSFPTGCRPYLVPLRATTPSPFDPSLQGRGFNGEDDQPPADDKQKDDAPPRTEVDPEGLPSRVVPVPVPAANYGNLRTAKDALIWLRHPLTGRLGDGSETTRETVLERYDLKKRAKSELGKEFKAFEVSGDGTRLVVNGKNGLQTRPATEGDDVVGIDLDRVAVQLDPVAEWRQGYHEAGRLMRDHFWREDMNGVDWQGALDRYAPLVERLGTHSELIDLLWEVQGELGTSHAYAIAGGGHLDPRRRQGLLGADLTRDPDGVWRVERILPGESSDHGARSPLLAPGVAVREGDALTAVNGRPVDATHGPLPLLAGTADQPVELTVRPATGGDPRKVVVTPIADETRLRYHDWVEGRRAHVRQESGGRLGYLHVPDMVASGWAQFHRDLRTEMAFEGLVVDVRENSGGHISELVLEKLSRRVTGWTRVRGYEPMRYPGDSPRGAIVTVTDEFAGSDGDIVSAGIKNRAIGPLVGVRTWGGVIGIDSRYSLVDGTVVTQPRYSFWLEGHGWGVENHGVDPDVEVVMAPHDRVAGRDPQLDKAIELALAALEERPAATPPDLPPLR